MTHQHIVPGLSSEPIPKSPAPTATVTSENQAPKPKGTADSVDSKVEKQDVYLSEIEQNLLRHAEASKQLSEMLAAAKKQSKNAEDFQQRIDKVTKEKDYLAKRYFEMEERYNKVKKENDQLAGEIAQLKKRVAIVDEHPNAAETQKLIEHLTTENKLLKEAREGAIEELKAQPIMQDMINRLVEEKEGLEEKHRNNTAEMKTQIQQLEQQAENSANEVKLLRKENKELQKGLGNAGQDGVSKDMAKLLKRYYEMEEQFGQMKKDIKQEVKSVFAKKDKKMFQQVQEKILENEKKMQDHLEKRLGETENHVQKQVEGRLIDNENQIQERLMENEKQIQERFGVNEVKIWGHGQEIQQNIKEIVAKHDKQIQGRLEANEVKIQQNVKETITEKVLKIEETLSLISGDTINEQGYLTRLIPLKAIPDTLTQITSIYGKVIIYVDRKKIKNFEDFEKLINSIWDLNFNRYDSYYKHYKLGNRSIPLDWSKDCATSQCISISKHPNNSSYHMIECTQ